MAAKLHLLRPSVCFEVRKIISTSEGMYQVEWLPSWVSGAQMIGCEDLIEQFEHDENKAIDLDTTTEEDQLTNSKDFADENEDEEIIHVTPHSPTGKGPSPNYRF